MAINIYDHDEYEVNFYNDTIITRVTKSPNRVDDWISRIESIHDGRLDRLIIGLDIEWRPNPTVDVRNLVATLQLCVGSHCLIYQILHSPYVPQSLENFLRNPNYTFTGVGIWDDVLKLSHDYNLDVSRISDLGELAAQVCGIFALNYEGLKGLTRRVLEKIIYKPKDITMSNWDEERLSPEQVQYACLDAFLSYELGRVLIIGDHN